MNRLACRIGDYHAGSKIGSLVNRLFCYSQALFVRQTRKRFAACLGWTILVSRPVRQALALDTFEGSCRPFPIVDAEGHAVIIAEIKFREIALQMRFADLMINASDAALKN